jgi:hypothetical protein
MKRFCILVFCGLALATSMQAQSPVSVEAGIRGGLTWTDLDMADVTANTPAPGTQYGSGNWNAGGQIVGHFRIRVLSFFAQPELGFTRNEGSIVARPPGAQEFAFKDYTFTRLDGHLSMGIRLFSVLRIQGGPSMSYLFDVRNGSADATSDFAATTFGWHAGIGADIFKLRLDVRFEPGLNHRMETIGGQSVNHSTRQLVLGVGLRF